MAESRHGRMTVSDALLLLTVATTWGSSYTLIKVAVETIPPVTMIFLRTLLAGSVLLLVLLLRGKSMPRNPRRWMRFLLQSLLNSVVPFTLIAWAELHIQASLAAILNSTSPIFVFLLTLAITRHEATPPLRYLGVALGLVGVCLTVGLDALNGIGGETLLAQLAILLASFCYANSALLSREFADLDPMVPACGSMLCGAALLLPVSLILDQPWTISPSHASIAATAALAIFSSAFGFVIFYWLVNRIGALSTTAQAYLRVPIGVGVGAFFLGETLPPTAWVGLALVVAGVAALTIPSRRSPTESPPLAV